MYANLSQQLLSSFKSSNTSQDFALESIVDRQFCQLTLRSLKVIGIIKKVRKISKNEINEWVTCKNLIPADLTEIFVMCSQGNFEEIFS